MDEIIAYIPTVSANNILTVKGCTFIILNKAVIACAHLVVDGEGAGPGRRRSVTDIVPTGGLTIILTHNLTVSYFDVRGGRGTGRGITFIDTITVVLAHDISFVSCEINRCTITGSSQTHTAKIVDGIQWAKGIVWKIVTSISNVTSGNNVGTVKETAAFARALIGIAGNIIDRERTLTVVRTASITRLVTRLNSAVRLVNLFSVHKVANVVLSIAILASIIVWNASGLATLNGTRTIHQRRTVTVKLLTAEVFQWRHFIQVGSELSQQRKGIRCFITGVTGNASKRGTVKLATRVIKNCVFQDVGRTCDAIL